MVWFAVAAAAASALSQKKQGDAAAAQSNVNASLAEQQAKNVSLQTGSQASQIRRQGSNILADQSAGFADNGTGTGGSNALLQRSTAIDTEMDVANNNFNGQQQIDNLQNEASSLRTAAKNQKPGLLSMLGGGASVAGTYYSRKG
ncbi:hypothetical protein EKS35_13750 [Enterobacter hormaechei subsp. steigerwaltii]|uniref:hypothetical protein n=1 Tax=Enterobacter hormaechei TaxID=158836 RepID=UPI000F8238DD|nr:hypothetical protein [Enterobacter hormaechei]MCR1002038.1 hypothetical protein [Enterobacter cloacae]RTY43998.1 hypothetical protein EKS35_13750 [Enterobacter hormaechei subsp. steigerwaltii]